MWVQFLMLLHCILQCSAINILGSASRPFYSFGHMANTIKDVDEFIELGTNAIEADLQFKEDGTPTEFKHPPPCDCFRWCSKTTEAKEYLKHIRGTRMPNNQKYQETLVLLYLDLKLNNVNKNKYKTAGVKTAELLLDNFLTGTNRIKVIAGIPDVSQSDFFKGLNNKIRMDQPAFLENIGYDIYTFGDNYDEIGRKYASLNITSRTWQTKGYTNCLLYSIDNYKEPLRLRNDPKSYINKVLVWTIDKQTSIEEILDMDVDGIMTNWADNLALVFSNKKFKSRFHIATHVDDPWQKIIVNRSPVNVFLQTALTLTQLDPK